MEKRFVFLRNALGMVVVVLALASYFLAAPKYSDWAAPVNLGPVVNSAFRDAAAAVSKDGESLYFNSDRPGGSGGHDIWVSQRDSVEKPWGPPVNLGAVVNTGVLDAGPALSRDEHWLFFQSSRGGGFGGLDIWASYRVHTHDNFGWQPPVNIGPGINSIFEDTDPEYLENEAGAPQLSFSSNRPGGVGVFDLYVSDMLQDGTFGPSRLIPELSSTVADPGVALTFDGLEAFLFSNRTGGLGGQDLWTARRETVFDPWSSPINLGPLVNSVLGDQTPHIAPDRQTLYFGSNRSGGFGDFDLYVTTRSREKH